MTPRVIGSCDGAGGQCIDVVASCKDSLLLSLWDYKTIGNDVKVGVARIECAELPLSSEKVFYHFPICNRCGQEVKGSNGQCAQISVAIATSPITTEIPVEKEWTEDAAASAAERNPIKQCPAPASDVPCKAAPIMTPVLDAVMIKLGSHCEHGGEALTFLGLDADGRVSARQLAAGMDRIGHPRLDLETLGRELQTGGGSSICCWIQSILSQKSLTTPLLLCARNDQFCSWHVFKNTDVSETWCYRSFAGGWCWHVQRRTLAASR